MITIDSILSRALKNDPYSPGESDITVTQLISPPQQVDLLRHNKPTETLGDNLKALYGQIIHGILERGAPESAIVEKRVYMNVLGWKIGGQIDLYHEGVLIDFKFTSTWTETLGDGIDNTKQLNAQAALMRANGYPVNALYNGYIYRDWSGSRARREPDYPPEAELIERDLWGDDICLARITEWVADHQKAAGGVPRDCTPEEQWHKPDKWAVMKKGRKSALRVLDSESDAEEWMEANGGTHIEHRPGENTRCLYHCRARHVCPQAKH